MSTSLAAFDPGPLASAPIRDQSESEPTYPPPLDPWEHRATRMRCASCMWFVVKQTQSPISSPLGRCRRHAPTMSGYPVVFTTDWCGDHKLTEYAV